jgi:hypothetical protein
MALPGSGRLIGRLSDIATTTPTDTLEATSELWQVVSNQQGKDDAVARILVAVTNLAKSTSSQQLNRVLGASSDYAVLLRLLSQPEALAFMAERDPLAPARLRGMQVRERLLAAEGGTLTAEEAGVILGVSRQAIDNRRKRGSLLGIQLGRRGYRYPAWQFSPDGLLPGLKETLESLAGLTPWIQLSFFLNENAWLDGRRPLDALRQGQVNAVVHAAGQYGEQSAA